MGFPRLLLVLCLLLGAAGETAAQTPTDILGAARPREGRVRLVLGHDQPRLGRPQGGVSDVFHERVVVPPQTSWARRGAEAMAAGRARLATTRLGAVGAQLRAADGSAMASRAILPATRAVTGTMRQAVVLVEFSPDSLQPDSVATSVFPAGGPQGVFDAYWGTGGGRANWATVGQFYRQSSGGRFSVTGELIAVVRVSRSMASYMALPSDRRLLTFLTELGDSLRVRVPASTFARFTEPYLPGRDIITPLAIVHTGIDGACGNAAGFWAHRSVWPPMRNPTAPFQIMAPMANGAYLGDYILQGARCSGSATSAEVVGPGILIHETGHLFGLADFYNPNTSASGLPHWTGGVGTWDIMSGYSSLAEPSQLSAFHRAVLGWATVQEVAVPASGRAALTLAPVRFTGTAAGGDTVLLLRASADPQEVLFIEHRTRTGTDRTLPEAGGVVWYANLSKLFTEPHLTTPSTVRGYEAPFGPNLDPRTPGLIVLPRTATWALGPTGRPEIPVATLADATQQRAWLLNAAWGRGTGQGPMGPRTDAPWRSFTTGAPGLGVIEQITWDGTPTAPLRLVLRGVGALDTLGALATVVTAADTARPVAGLPWAGARVTTRIPTGLTATWGVGASSGLDSVVVGAPDATGARLVQGVVALTASASASVTLQLTLSDAYTTRTETVPVMLGPVVVRPWARLEEASRAFLRGTLTGDAARFVDAHGNRNGAPDLGDLQQLFAKRLVTP